MAITAHGVAMKSEKTVMHFFEPSSSSKEDPIQLEDQRVLDRMLDRRVVKNYQSSTIDVTTIYAVDEVQVQTRQIPQPNDVGINSTKGTSNSVQSPLMSLKNASLSVYA